MRLSLLFFVVGGEVLLSVAERRGRVRGDRELTVEWQMIVVQFEIFKVRGKHEVLLE